MSCGIFRCSLPGLAGPDLKGEAVSPVEHTRRSPAGATTRVRGHAHDPRRRLARSERSTEVATVAGRKWQSHERVDHRGHRGHRRDLRRDEAPRDRPQPRPFVGRVQEGPEGRRRGRRRHGTRRHEARRDRPTRPRTRSEPPHEGVPRSPGSRAILPRMPFTNACDSSAESSDAASTASLIATDVGHVVAVAAAPPPRPAGSSGRAPPCAPPSTRPRAPRAGDRSPGACSHDARRPARARTGAPRARPRATTRGRASASSPVTSAWYRMSIATRRASRRVLIVASPAPTVVRPSRVPCTRRCACRP